MPEVTAIIQAHMGSTRLPGKVLMDLGGEPMLSRVVKRTMRAQKIDKVIVATTTKPQDEVIVDLCRSEGWLWFCGSEEDVLDRYYQTAKKYGSDIVVRITSDCPLIEPEIIDLVIDEFLKSQADYASNSFAPRTYPRGLDTEVISFAALKRAWQEDKNPAWREHVTPYIYRHPDKFKLCAVRNDRDYSYLRWTVDTAQDLELVRKIYEHFGNDRFSWQEVITLLQKYPEWLKINKDVMQKEVP